MARSLSWQQLHLSDDPDDWVWARWYWTQAGARPLDIVSAFDFNIFDTDHEPRLDTPGLPFGPGGYASSRVSPYPGIHRIGLDEWWRDGLPLADRVGPTAGTHCGVQAWYSEWVASLAGTSSMPDVGTILMGGGGEGGGRLAMAGPCLIFLGSGVCYGGGGEGGGPLSVVYGTAALMEGGGEGGGELLITGGGGGPPWGGVAVPAMVASGGATYDLTGAYADGRRLLLLAVTFDDSAFLVDPFGWTNIGGGTLSSPGLTWKLWRKTWTTGASTTVSVVASSAADTGVLAVGIDGLGVINVGSPGHGNSATPGAGDVYLPTGPGLLLWWYYTGLPVALDTAPTAAATIQIDGDVIDLTYDDAAPSDLYTGSELEADVPTAEDYFALAVAIEP